MHFYRFRRRLRHASGVIFAFSLLLFVICLLYISLSSYPNSTISDHHPHYKSRQNPSNIAVQSSQTANQQDPKAARQQFLRNASWTLPPPSPGDEQPEQQHGPTLLLMTELAGDPEKALESIQFLNAHHEVLNADRFGPLSADNVDYVLVIQVHDREEYLSYLIGSLSRARGIDRALLVFSHDLNNGQINKMVQSINFSRVIQLFFPYNIQLFPNIYPGHSPLDCPEGVDKAKAAELDCVDSASPDVGGHYRLPKLTQIKHHWWWKINYVFDGILPKYGLDQKLLLLLEEDHLVAPDFMHTLKQMEQKRAKVCQDCELLCLGSYPKSFGHYGEDLAKLGVEIWYSSKYNMGMAVGKQLWERIRSENCSKFFCDYDDYNWDWTLMQLSVKCLSNKMRVIYTKAPRVIHIGDCGVHTHRCQADNAVHDALKLFQRVNASFFPAQLEVADIGKRMLKPSKPNGGWGDPRDRQLCQLNTKPAEGMAGEVLAKARGALGQWKREEEGRRAAASTTGSSTKTL